MTTGTVAAASLRKPPLPCHAQLSDAMTRRAMTTSGSRRVSDYAPLCRAGGKMVDRRLTQSAKLIIGIDIGVQGAVAVLDQDGALVQIHDTPTLRDGLPAVARPLVAALVFKSAGGGS